MQPAGRNGNPCSICFVDFGSRRAGDRAIAEIEAELPMRLTDEVQHRHAVLAFEPAEAAPELLHEDQRALGRTQEQQCVDFGKVHAFVEEVHGEERASVPFCSRRAPCGACRCRCSADTACEGRPASLKRRAMNSACAMLTQNPSALIVCGSRSLSCSCCSTKLHSRIVSGVEVFECGDVVALRDHSRAKVGVVAQAEILEWAEQPALERVPQSQLRSDVAVEVVEDVVGVRAFRRRGQPDQLASAAAARAPAIGRCRRVMELVDDHHVERFGSMSRGPCCARHCTEANT